MEIRPPKEARTNSRRTNMSSAANAIQKVLESSERLEDEKDIMTTMVHGVAKSQT